MRFFRALPSILIGGCHSYELEGPSVQMVPIHLLLGEGLALGMEDMEDKEV